MRDVSLYFLTAIVVNKLTEDAEDTDDDESNPDFSINSGYIWDVFLSNLILESLDGI